ncbi:MAG: 30S ribosomal protein S20 [Puniceicoccales bacterium]|jgi:small subunit ribosomal protein S20|nr:30S ribosomal protein S20 [Puniceicoccales bacterium]
MANLRSSQKDVRRIVRRTARNRSVKTLLKSLDKKVQGALSVGNDHLSAESAIACISAMDKAVKRGVIHKNKANRYKSAKTALIFKKGA